jgi:ABC-type glycerol-3-phosphate transport system substrate-binding protein
MNRKILVKINARADEVNQQLSHVLAEYGGQKRIEIECDFASAGSEYAELVRATIHNHPLDVTELGTTFVRDFVAMNGLRPFQPGEMRLLGSQADFFPFLWQAGVAENQAWAIPWFSDVRLFFYRRDWLQKAGVDEATAFSSPAHLEQTLQALKAIGIAGPWSISSHRGLLLLHALSSWVWHHGGEFLDPVNRKVLLDSPAVIRGMQDFYRLHRYEGDNWKEANESDALSLFLHGQAAVTLSGPWVFWVTKFFPDVLANMGIAPVFGRSFVGGSCLGIWKQAGEQQAAVDVIRYLTSPEFQTQVPHQVGMLPARIDALETYPLPREDFRPVVKQALQTGRELPDFSLWGLIESRLVTALAKLWDDIYANPNGDLDDLVARQMAVTTRRLNSLIAQH